MMSWVRGVLWQGKGGMQHAIRAWGRKKCFRSGSLGSCLLYLHPVGRGMFHVIGRFGRGVLLYVLSIVGLIR